MIILFNEKVKVMPDGDTLQCFFHCLDYLASEMKAHGLHATANIVDVAKLTLLEPQSYVPMSIEEEALMQAKTKTSGKIKKMPELKLPGAGNSE